MKTKLRHLSLLLVLLLVPACSHSGGAGDPTPPPLKPFQLGWDASPAGDNVKYYNVYTVDLAGLHSYFASVYVPAPTTFPLPLGVTPGTTYVVTASNGNQESPFSNAAVVPAGPAAPKNAKITVAP